jgi:hypothetical protein
MPLAIALLSHRPLYAQHVLFSSVAAHFSFIKEPAEVIRTEGGCAAVLSVRWHTPRWNKSQ